MCVLLFNLFDFVFVVVYVFVVLWFMCVCRFGWLFDVYCVELLGVGGVIGFLWLNVILLCMLYYWVGVLYEFGVMVELMFV